MSEGENKMGASKEGRMGVRDKINAVLQEFFLEDDESSSSQSENNTCCDSTAAAGGGGGGSSSAAGVPTTVSVAVNCKIADLVKASSESCSEMSPRSRVSGGDVIVEGSGGAKGVAIGQHSYDKEDATYIVMQNLLAQQLRLIGSLNTRLSSTESKWKEVSQEKDQLQVTLEHERKHSAEIQSESDVIIRDQEEKIRELQKQLAEATFIKPREDKATCVTPPPPQPPPPPPPPPSTSPLPPHSMWDDMDVTSPPLYKRPRMDIMMGQPETKSRFLLPPSHNTFLSPPSSSSYSSGTNAGHHPPRLSESPPQLSPVVTPKSALKTLGRPRDNRSYLGQNFQEAGDDSVIGGPTDEFQDELVGIHSGGRSHHEQRTDTSAYHQHHHPPVSLSAQQGSSSKTSSSSYSSTSLTPYFSQAPSFPNKSRHTRFMFPDGKKRFIPNTSSDSSFQPVNKSSTVSSLPNSHTNSYAAHHHHHHHHHSSSNAIRNRSNNFLNLNRPLMKKAPVGIIIPPPNQEHQNQQSQVIPSSSSSFHFRSLDLDGMATDESAAASASHKSQQRQLPEETASVPSISPSTPGVVKKRKVGRPPGSGMKSKRIQPVSSTSRSPGPGPSPSGQLANGSVSSQPDTPSTTPQKFSQRGRLLKPNRARYSPDPDISIPTPTREKFVTTKRGYFVGQPFVHEMEYSSEQGHEDDEEVLEMGSRKGPLSNCMDTEVDEEGLQQGRPSVQSSSSAGIIDDGGGDGISSTATGPLIVVEVPQWRISIVEGFSDEEERLPNEDDMSDEAFLKRHQKLEQKEKQRKRWDSQRMREESYLERLKRKQEERERQKELRRQQRKRKGRLGASEEESVTPSAEEIKAIHIGSELPVGAFGHPLPLVEKVDFNLVWETVPSSTTPTTVVPPPTAPAARNSSPPLVPQEISLVPDEDVPKLSTSTDSSEPVLAQGIPVILQQTKETCSSGAPSPFTAVPSLSSPSSSSLSLPSIPSPCNSPPPPEVFSVFEENSSDAPRESDEENVIEPTSSFEPMETEEDTGILVVEDEPEKLDSDDEEDSDPDSPVYSVDLVDYVIEPDLITSEGASDTEEITTVTLEPAESCDLPTIPVSATPSISIPLRSPASPKVAAHATTITTHSESATDTNTTLNGTSEQRTKCSTVVHFPQIASLTAVFSQANSTALRSVPSVTPISTSSTITSTAGVSKTSITFFMPNNPLAPRHHHHSSSISTPKRTTPLVVPSSLSSEFSMEKSDS